MKKLLLVTFSGISDQNFGSALQLCSLHRMLSKHFDVDLYQTQSINQNGRFFSWLKDNKLIPILKEKTDFSKYDAILFGGDQVFCDNCFNSFYNEQLLSQNYKYFTYAASFGEMKPYQLLCPKKKQKKMLQFIYQKFKKIYLRECRPELRIDNEDVVDPVLLNNVAYYKQMMNKPEFGIPENFKFQYFTHSSIHSFNVPVDSSFIVLDGKKTNNDLDLTPPEWLWLVCNCKELHTNSYHAFVFGCMFNKKIFSYFDSRRIRYFVQKHNISFSMDSIANYSNMMQSIEKHKEQSLRILNKEVISYAFEERLLQLYCGYSNDKSIRDNSSSGGICGEIARQFLTEENGVVVGCGYSRDFMSTEYKIASTIEEYMQDIACSKYLESDITTIYDDISKHINAKHSIMVVGCPCQIRQIKNRFNYDDLFTVDFICHGCAKTLVYQKQIASILHGNAIESITMRNQHKIQMKIVDSSKNTYCSSNIISELLKKSNFADKCQNCMINDGKHSCADITLGDFWQFNKNVHDEKINPKNGVSRIQLNTQKGIEFFEKIKSRLTCLKLS